MRLTTLPVILLALAPAMAAQDPQFIRPPEWQMRFDRAGTADSLLYFVSMPPGWHVTTGPSVILWDPATEASGTFEVSSEIHLFPGERREGFGVFVGGRNLEGADQAYAYFLIRKDGRFLVKLRRGTDTEEVTPWTAHEAILPHDGGDGTVKNVLGIRVGSEAVEFLVNGTVVATHARARIAPDGIVGLRVNHALNLHVTTLEVTSMDPGGTR